MSATKAKKRTSKAAAEDYESDGGFVANDDDSAPKSKKAKTKAPARAPVKTSTGGNDQDEEFWEVEYPQRTSDVRKLNACSQWPKITPTRRVNISEFKGQRMVNIREYYEDKNSGAMLPGKKVRLGSTPLVLPSSDSSMTVFA